jgi:hypothetical protein
LQFDIPSHSLEHIPGVPASERHPAVPVLVDPFAEVVLAELVEPPLPEVEPAVPTMMQPLPPAEIAATIIRNFDLSISIGPPPILPKWTSYAY